MQRGGAGRQQLPTACGRRHKASGEPEGINGEGELKNVHLTEVCSSWTVWIGQPLGLRLVI